MNCVVFFVESICVTVSKKAARKIKVSDVLGHKNKVVDTNTITDDVDPDNDDDGDPDNDDADDPPQYFFVNQEKRPPSKVRYDQLGHFPVIDRKRNASRCKLEGCKGRVRTMCTKCRLHLCLVTDRECFIKFHTKPK
uniref:Uncharacterized protein n=1 Tax=Cacopsylla melanoneura TaxID=428564 RepID=A0A8D9DYL5_9HEMI